MLWGNEQGGVTFLRLRVPRSGTVAGQILRCARPRSRIPQTRPSVLFRTNSFFNHGGPVSQALARSLGNEAGVAAATGSSRPQRDIRALEVAAGKQSFIIG